jgi:hypothetical protein
MNPLINWSSEIEQECYIRTKNIMPKYLFWETTFVFAKKWCGSGFCVADPVFSETDRDPGSDTFLPLVPESGMEKIQILDPGSAINILDHNSTSLVTIIWVKNWYISIFYCGSGSGIRDSVPFWPWIRDGKLRIRDKHSRICNTVANKHRIQQRRIFKTASLKDAGVCNTPKTCVMYWKQAKI